MKPQSNGFVPLAIRLQYVGSMKFIHLCNRENILNYSLGENKNRLYFARIYVYILHTCSYTAKMRAIACLVFLKIAV